MTSRLAQLRISRSEIENVVNNLEHHAVCSAIGSQCINHFAAMTSNKTANACGR